MRNGTRYFSGQGFSLKCFGRRSGISSVFQKSSVRHFYCIFGHFFFQNFRMGKHIYGRVKWSFGPFLDQAVHPAVDFPNGCKATHIPTRLECSLAVSSTLYTLVKEVSSWEVLLSPDKKRKFARSTLPIWIQTSLQEIPFGTSFHFISLLFKTLTTQLEKDSDSSLVPI